jgi:hypothetical protein
VLRSLAHSSEPALHGSRHGCHDARRDDNLFIFGCRPSDIGGNQSYLPQLSCLLARHGLARRSEARPRFAARHLPVLAVREREVLLIYLGKGNAEVGTILHITRSP